jgi:cell division protease FtsH
VSLAALAQATPGMSGADLANLTNEAALTAARKGAATVTPCDFEEALDRITLGAPGMALIDEEERRTVAYHEAGHALVALLSPHGDPVHRVTIVPRGRSLGVTQFRALDDRRNYRRDYLHARLAIGLGGRAAEEVACAEITSGVQNDLQEVARLARLMVTQLGMADDLGLACSAGCADPPSDHLTAPWEARPYSDETARRIDVAIQRLVDEAHERAGAMLTDNRGALDAIAAALLREESLDGDDLAALVSRHGASGAARPILAPSSRTTY